MTMKSDNLSCDAAEVWVLQKVCAQYHIPHTVLPTEAGSTQVRLFWHANTMRDWRRLQLVMEGAQAALTALHFMGRVRVAETVNDSR